MLTRYKMPLNLRGSVGSSSASVWEGKWWRNAHESKNAKNDKNVSASAKAKTETTTAREGMYSLKPDLVWLQVHPSQRLCNNEQIQMCAMTFVFAWMYAFGVCSYISFCINARHTNESISGPSPVAASATCSTEAMTRSHDTCNCNGPSSCSVNVCWHFGRRRRGRVGSKECHQAPVNEKATYKALCLVCHACPLSLLSDVYACVFVGVSECA